MGLISARRIVPAAAAMLTIRREFTSTVSGQVCPKEIESELTEPLQRVARSLQTQMSFQTPAPNNGPAKVE